VCVCVCVCVWILENPARDALAFYVQLPETRLLLATDEARTTDA